MRTKQRSREIEELLLTNDGMYKLSITEACGKGPTFYKEFFIIQSFKIFLNTVKIKKNINDSQNYLKNFFLLAFIHIC